jgi:hypothetical protein
MFRETGAAFRSWCTGSSFFYVLPSFIDLKEVSPVFAVNAVNNVPVWRRLSGESNLVIRGALLAVGWRLNAAAVRRGKWVFWHVPKASNCSFEQGFRRASGRG